MPRKKKQDLATLPEYERMSDTVDNLSEQKKSTAPAKKTRQERKAERKEIKARKKSEAALKKKAKKLVIPKTVQQTIPYLRVYPDSGIIETKNGVFTKGYLLQDVNYTSARDEEQTDMFLKFAEFLNTFDPQTQFQILISQQNLNMAQFEQETMMPLIGDGFDELREEINNEVRTKIKQGRNNLIKYKYLFLQRTESSYEEAVASFARLDGEIVTNFSKIGGAVAQPMSSAKRLELLHDIYNPDSVGLFGNNMQYEDGRLVFSTENFRFDVMRRMGLSTKDMVAPDSFTFRPDYGMVGNQYFRVLFMKTYPESLRDSILKSLSDVDCKLVLSMHYVPINPERALSMVRADIVNVNANLIKEQKNASKSGYSVDLINPTLQAAAQDLNNLLDDLTAKSQKLFYQTFAICHFADSKEKLDSDTKTIQSIGRGYLVDIRPLTGQQEIGLNSCLPLCSNKLEIRRTLITESAAVFMPLDNQELYNPEKGSIFYGINEGSKNLVYANRLDLKNGNGNIIGAPGSGKSTASKKEMEEVRLKDPNAVIIVIDPEGEYKPLAELLGGEVIRIAPGSGVNLNPFDIELDTEEENPIAQKSDFIKALMQTIIGGDNERQGVTLTAAQPLRLVHYIAPKPYEAVTGAVSKAAHAVANAPKNLATRTVRAAAKGIAKATPPGLKTGINHVRSAFGRASTGIHNRVYQAHRWFANTRLGHALTSLRIMQNRAMAALRHAWQVVSGVFRKVALALGGYILVSILLLCVPSIIGSITSMVIMSPDSTTSGKIDLSPYCLVYYNEFTRFNEEIAALAGEIAKLNEDIRTMYGSNSVIRENNQVKEENELLILEMSYLRAVMKED